MTHNNPKEKHQEAQFYNRYNLFYDDQWVVYSENFFSFDIDESEHDLRRLKPFNKRNNHFKEDNM